MTTWRSLAVIVIGASLCLPAATFAQTPSSDAKADMPGNDMALPLDQVIIKTVHEAWVASGRNEDKFFTMVQQLAELSAHNRGVILPDSQEAGSKFGAWIKQEARKDPDQLLYAVVDHAVRHIGKTQTAAADSTTAPKK